MNITLYNRKIMTISTVSTQPFLPKLKNFMLTEQFKNWFIEHLPFPFTRPYEPFINSFINILKNDPGDMLVFKLNGTQNAITLAHDDRKVVLIMNITGSLGAMVKCPLDMVES